MRSRKFNQYPHSGQSQLSAAFRRNELERINQMRQSGQLLKETRPPILIDPFVDDDKVVVRELIGICTAIAVFVILSIIFI